MSPIYIYIYIYMGDYIYIYIGIDIYIYRYIDIYIYIHKKVYRTYTENVMSKTFNYILLRFFLEKDIKNVPLLSIKVV